MADVTEYYDVKEGFIINLDYRGNNTFSGRFFSAPSMEINYPRIDRSPVHHDSDSDQDTDNTHLIEPMWSCEDDMDTDSCRPGCFTKTFKANDFKKLYLRKGFFTGNELEHYKGVRVQMSGSSAYKHVGLNFREREETGELVKGWGDFVRGSNLHVVDKIHLSAEHDVGRDILKVIVRKIE